MKKYYIFLWVMFFIIFMPFSIRATEILGETKSTESAKLTVALIDLAPGEGVSKEMAANLSDYLRVQLLHTQMFIVVTRENIEDVLKEQKFQLSGLTKDELVKVGQLLGVQMVFTGSIGKVGPSYLITLKMIDVGSGEILKAETEKCTGNKEGSLINSIKNIVDKIIGSTSKEEQQEQQGQQGQQENILAQMSKKSAAELNADVDSYTKAIKLNPENADAYTCRGWAHSFLHQCQKSIDDYTKSIELNPKDALVYICRGVSYSALGQYQKAIDDSNKAIEINPKDARGYINRGVYYEALGNLMGACDNYYQAGVLYLKEGNRTQALNCINSLKHADPSSPLIKKLMDKIYGEE